jgi:hypothetical protein
MTSPGLDPRARPIAAACFRSVRPRHRYAARQLSLLQSEGVPRSATALSQDLIGNRCDFFLMQEVTTQCRMSSVF